MSAPWLDIDALNAADDDAFEAAVAPLFEGAPRFLFRLAASRPYASWEGLFERARALAHAMPWADQVELVDAHPRLGAPPGSVSELSFGEQGYDRGDAGAPAPRSDPARIAARLEELNRAYEDRFGFRYCVFVAGRPRSDLIAELEAALSRERDSELHRGLDAVIDIAIDRHRRLASR